ncbi:MAG: dienelactone hydrolase family protein [Deltaproteobacteria bacterium]
MSKMIEFNRPDGTKCPAYYATPAAQDGAPGVVIIQEWWGLNDQIKKVADRVAATGFRALVPDLYRGKLTTDGDEANHMMNDLDWGDACSQDIRGALQHLALGGKKTGVMGFCMGGALTILSAVNLEETRAAVCFYGIPPAEAADPAKIRCPFLGHFATDDDWCNAAAVEALQGRLDAGGVDAKVHVYEKTKHAFFNDARPEVFDKEASAMAWARSIDFLKKHLS